jgi:hypothetical protein
MVYVAVLATAGCGTHGVAHVAPDESRPHLSWEIRAGGTDGDAQSVCGSNHAGKPCVLTASSDARRTLATVHVLAHAAARPTTYLGFVRAPFLEGDADRRPAEISVTLAPGSRPVGTTILGRVTTPGSSTLTILMEATQPGDAFPAAIGQKIDVTIK